MFEYCAKKNNKLKDKVLIDFTLSLIALLLILYNKLFDRQSVLPKKLLKALVINGENGFSSDYGKRFRLSATSSVQKAIVVLMDNGLIDRTMNKYFISDPFFRRYIENYALKRNASKRNYNHNDKQIVGY